jgi:hypothetical protein
MGFEKYTIWNWLIFAFLMWCGWRFLKGFSSAPLTKAPDVRPAAKERTQNIPNGPLPLPESLMHWRPSGRYDLAIIGENFYQQHLNALAGHAGLSPGQELKACLAPENENPYNNQAVRVDIGGDTVGYLSEEDGIRFRHWLESVNLTNQITTCNAMIAGGDTDEQGKEKPFTVSLDMANGP